MLMKSPIIEQIEAVKEVCSTAKQSKDINEKIGNYKNYLDILKEAHQKFLELISQYDVLKSIDEDIKNETKECFQQYKTGFTSLVDNIRNDSAYNQHFFALKGLNTNFERIIMQNWKNFVQSKIWNVFRTLQVFQDFIGFTKFKQIQNEFDMLNSSFPSEKNLKFINEFVSMGDEIIQGMNADDEIISFISKVSSNRATLNDLSEKIIKWFKDHNYTDKIKITM